MLLLFLYTNFIYLFIILQQDELKEWVFPTSYNYIQAEASHLIYHADSNEVCAWIIYSFSCTCPLSVHFIDCPFVTKSLGDQLSEKKHVMFLCIKHVIIITKGGGG